MRDLGIRAGQYTWISRGNLPPIAMGGLRGVELCDPGRTRTFNLTIKSRLLCQIELRGLSLVPRLMQRDPPQYSYSLAHSARDSLRGDGAIPQV